MSEGRGPRDRGLAKPDVADRPDLVALMAMAQSLPVSGSHCSLVGLHAPCDSRACYVPVARQDTGGRLSAFWLICSQILM
jgi:hypothetical protein